VIHAPAARQRYTEEPQAAYTQTAGQRVRGWMARGLILLCIGLIIMIAGYILLNIVSNWWTNTTNNWTYGYPRTYQIDYNVCHGSFEDVNHDGTPDLVIHAENVKFVFLNEKVKGVWKFVPAPGQ
jgi:hypothetical protein